MVDYGTARQALLDLVMLNINMEKQVGVIDWATSLLSFIEFGKKVRNAPPLSETKLRSASDEAMISQIKTAVEGPAAELKRQLFELNKF